MKCSFIREVEIRFLKIDHLNPVFMNGVGMAPKMAIKFLQVFTITPSPFSISMENQSFIKAI